MLTVKEIAERTGKTVKAVHRQFDRHGVRPQGRNTHGESLYGEEALETAGRRRKRAYYKVSVLNPARQWIVKAVCLTKMEAGLISDELGSLGIAARAKPHSFGAGK